MPFEVRMGIPEMKAYWDQLQAGAEAGTLDREERELAKKFAKAVKHLGANPFHPGLQSHEIDDLTSRYGLKVFESYLENNRPSAGRVFWVYGPERGQITVIGLEPHPEDSKKGAYQRVKLSALPKPNVKPNVQTAEDNPAEKKTRHGRGRRSKK